MLKNTFNLIVSAIGTAFTFLFGGFDLTLQILVILMVTDYITGMMGGAKEQGLSSKIGIQGIKKKVIMLIYLMIGVMVDRLIGGDSFVFRTAITFYLIGNEALSIAENGTRIGFPMPTKLVQALSQLKEKGDVENGDNTK